MRILFQGDSITDAGRNRENPKNLAGYTAIIADNLGDRHEYYNLGISGNTVKDLINRYEKDFKEINPDIITILIGINDIWRRFDSNSYTSDINYYNTYKELLGNIKKDMPKTKLVLIEPFLIDIADKMHWVGDLGRFQRQVRRLATEFSCSFLNIDGIFAKECIKTAARDLSGDGVHLSALGNEVLAKHLIEEIKNCTE